MSVNTSQALGSRIGRHTLIYGASGVVTLLVGLATTAALTRFLAPSEYGRLALVLFFASLLTVVYNLGSLQGSVGIAFGGTDEDLGAEEEQDEAADAEAQRRVLGTGVVWTVALGIVGTLLVVVFARGLTHPLGLPRGDSGVVIWGAVAGAASAPARLLNNIARYARRPVLFGFLANARPVLILSGASLLLATGAGLQRAIAGFAIGSLLSLALTGTVMRRQFMLTFSGAFLRRIFQRGGGLIPVALSFFSMQQGTIFLLSLYVADAEVGRFRVASSIASIGAYGVGSFTAAWGPMLRSPLQAAAEEEYGIGVVAGELASYFVLATITLLTGLALFADTLVAIAPGDYSDAAPLVPLVAAGYVCWGWFVVSYRTVQFHARRTAFIALSVASAAVFFIVSVLLIPPLGTYGAALGTIVGFLFGAVAMLVLERRIGPAVGLRWRRIIVCLMLAAAAVAAGRGLASVVGPFAPATEAAALAAYLGVALWTGLVIPRSEARAILATLRSIVPTRHRKALRESLAALHEDDLYVLDALLRRGTSPAAVAAVVGESEEAVLAHLATLVAEIGSVGGESLDARVGSYVLPSLTFASRQHLGRTLIQDGTSPLLLDALFVTATELRSMPARAWPGATPTELRLVASQEAIRGGI